MATVDLRTLQERNQGGSDLFLFGLTEAQAKEALGDPEAVAAWYLVSFLSEEGGTMGPDRDVQPFYTEGGERDETVNRDEFVINGRFVQTSDRVLKLAAWLEKNYVPAKRALPVRQKGEGGKALHQLWYFPKMKFDKTNWEMSTARQGTRERPFTARAEKLDPMDEAMEPFAFATVDLEEEESWPPELADAKETVFQTTP